MNRNRHFFNHITNTYLHILILILMLIVFVGDALAADDLYLRTIPQTTTLDDEYTLQENRIDAESAVIETDLEEVTLKDDYIESEPLIRILLEEDLKSVTISGEMEIIGMIVPIVAHGEQIFTTVDVQGPLMITPVRGNLLVNGQPYRGQIMLTPTTAGMRVINFLKLEEYLYSVLPSEIAPGWPIEVLKAQAVAARCYALTQIKEQEEFDLYDDVRSQVYYGVRKENPNTTAAVQATRGQVGIYDGKIIQAYFYAAGGGSTANSEDVWGRALPYLRSVPDFDQQSPHFQWKASFTTKEIESLLKAVGVDVGVVLDLEPVEVDQSDRVVKIKIIGYDGDEVMKGTDFRFALGLKSTKFTIVNHSPQQVNPQSVEELVKAVIKQNNHKPDDFTGNVPAGIELVGQGWGHGVGLSQWGAYAMAVGDADYRQILTHYYQDIEIFSLYE